MTTKLDPDSSTVLAECREYLLDRLAGVARNANLRDPAALAALRGGAGEFFDALAKGGASGFEQAGNLTASKIRLVDDDQLEFAIALTELSGQLADHCGNQLSRLQLRMMTLLDTDRYEAASNPAGPEAICAGIDAACAEIGGALADLLALLDSLKSALLAELPAIYSAMDELLVRRRVAPRALPRGAADGGTRSRDPARGRQAQGDMLAALQGAVLSRAGVQASRPDSPRGVALDPAIAAILLERALSELDAAQRVDAAETGSATQNVLQAMKAAHAAPQLDAAGAASLDALAMVFDEIFDSTQLPDAVKAIIGRLQIPLLKVSLLDPSFLGDSSHPARRLLDTMAAAAGGLSPKIGSDHPVCVRLRSAAAVVQAEFQRDVGVFARICGELNDFVMARELEASSHAARYISLAEREDGREFARGVAMRTLRGIDDSSLPEVLQDFLANEWVQVLAAVLEQHGEDGVEWREHVEVARNLVWSVEPKVAPADRQRLLGLLPKLLMRLNSGLDRIGFPAAARAPLLDAFVSLHSSAMRGKAAGPSTAASGQSEATKPGGEPKTRACSSHDAAGAILVALTAESALDDAAGSEASTAREGDWVRFCMPDDTSQCGRVAWIGPRAGVVLLTSPEWPHAVSLTPALLDAQFKSGRAGIERSGSLVDAAALHALRLYG